MPSISEPPTLIKTGSGGGGLVRGAFADGPNTGAKVTPRPGDPQYEKVFSDVEQAQDYFSGAMDEPRRTAMPRGTALVRSATEQWALLGDYYYCSFSGVLWRCSDPTDPDTAEVLSSSNWQSLNDIIHNISHDESIQYQEVNDVKKARINRGRKIGNGGKKKGNRRGASTPEPES